MNIKRSIDVEEELRAALSEYMTVYVRPLPADPTIPHIEITAVGGTQKNGEIDRFSVTLDSRAEEEETASLNLRNAIGIIRKIAEDQSTAVRYADVNAMASWGSDPVRPDLAMCSARLNVIAHVEEVEI